MGILPQWAGRMWKRNEFQRAVSLGPWCRSKFNIQRVFGESLSPSTVFDWQGTPTKTFLSYLEHDFQGMFERADLEIAGTDVVNRRFGSIHVHEFPHTDDRIETDYARARERHDYLCAKTRAIFLDDVRTLFVFSHVKPQDELNKIIRAVRRLRRGRKCRFVTAPDKHLPPTDPKEIWQGNHAAWDVALAPYTIINQRTAG